MDIRFCELPAAWEQHLCSTEGLVAHTPGQDSRDVG